MRPLSNTITYPLVAFLLSGLILYFSLHGYVSQKRLPPGINVSGWELSKGTTFDQLQASLDQRIQAIYGMRVRLADPAGRVPASELSLQQLGLRVDKAKLLEEFEGLQQGSLLRRVKARWGLRGAAVDLPYSFDLAAMEQTLKQSWKAMYGEQPVNAQRIILPDDQISLIPGKSVYRIDQKKLEERLKPLVTGAAWVEGGAAGSVTVELPLLQIGPSITLDSLKAQGVERKLTQFSTSFPSGDPGRIHNVRSTAQTISDMLMAPGEVFDYGKVVAKTEAQFGYREAPVIVDGKIVPGIGGGICQVSTTLYNAVLRSGLEVVERRNHTLPISYAPLGQDATFANGYINFKFRNNTGHYLLIRTETDDRQVTVKLFGNTPSNITYDIESKVLETLPAPDKYVRNSALQVGAKQLLLRGKPGYIVETYRYTRENGKIVAQTKVSRDTYAAQPNLYAVNSGSPEPPKEKQAPPQKHIVEDGVKGPIFPGAR